MAEIRKPATPLGLPERTNYGTTETALQGDGETVRTAATSLDVAAVLTVSPSPCKAVTRRSVLCTALQRSFP